jgi:hypothetical protein
MAKRRGGLRRRAGSRRGQAIWRDGVGVSLVAAARRVVATWNVAPLTGPDLLRQLRSPLMTRPDVA